MPLARRKLAAYQHSAQTDFAAWLDEPLTNKKSDPSTINERSTVTLTQPENFVSSPFMALVPIYTIKLVVTDRLALRERITISGPSDAVNLLFKHLYGADREHFVVLLLDTKGNLIGVSTISVGDLASALVHPREVFKPAILANAARVLLAHNHPSGDPQPSPEDVAVTRRLVEAGEILGIEVVDHVVIGAPGQWVSLRQQGKFSPAIGSASTLSP